MSFLKNLGENIKKEIKNDVKKTFEKGVSDGARRLALYHPVGSDRL